MKKTMSRTDLFLRRKYMGVCRWESQVMLTTMRALPSTVVTYTARKNTNKKNSSSRKRVTSRKTNSLTVVWLLWRMMGITFCRVYVGRRQVRVRSTVS